MNDERRYDDDEVARILEVATEAGQETGSSLPAVRDASHGLTLSELQEIGDEVGISRELIVRAAAAIDAKGPAEIGGPLGIPLRVSRVVDLPRTLTDHEWDRLVAGLRQTFEAQGVVSRSGSLRGWSNGNLHVLVEPTESGHQLRLGTRRGDVAAFLSVSVGFLTLAAILLVVSLLSGVADLSSILTLGLVGAAGAGLNLARLPRWSKTRARQMDEIATTVSEWTALPAPDGEEDG